MVKNELTIVHHIVVLMAHSISSLRTDVYRALGITDKNDMAFAVAFVFTILPQILAGCEDLIHRLPRYYFDARSGFYAHIRRLLEMYMGTSAPGP